MGRGRVTIPIKDGDWKSLRQAINRLSAIVLGSETQPTYTGLTITELTASRLAATDANKKVVSVGNLASWIGGTTNRVSVADDSDGTITLSGPQDIHTGASPTFDALTLTSTPLPISSGGTGQGTATPAFDALSPTGTKGALAV